MVRVPEPGDLSISSRPPALRTLEMDRRGTEQTYCEEETHKHRHLTLNTKTKEASATTIEDVLQEKLTHSLQAHTRPWYSLHGGNP